VPNQSDMTLTTHRSSQVFRAAEGRALDAQHAAKASETCQVRASSSADHGGRHARHAVKCAITVFSDLRVLPGRPGRRVRGNRRSRALVKKALVEAFFLTPTEAAWGSGGTVADDGLGDPCSVPHAAPLWLQPGGRVRFRLAA
jgi:hypothetical protein